MLSSTQYGSNNAWNWNFNNEDCNNNNKNNNNRVRAFSEFQAIALAAVFIFLFQLCIKQNVSGLNWKKSFKHITNAERTRENQILKLHLKYVVKINWLNCGKN